MLFIVWSIVQLQRHGTSHNNPLESQEHNITLLLPIEQIFHLEGCFHLLVWELSLHGRSRVVPAAPCSWPDPWPQQVPVAVSSFDIKSTGCRFIWILQKSYWSQECWGKLGRGRRGSRHQSFDKVRHIEVHLSFCASFVWQHIHHWLILPAATLVVFNLLAIEIHWNIFFRLQDTSTLNLLFASRQNLHSFVFFRSPTNINLPKNIIGKLTKGISTNHLSYISQAHLPTTACLRPWTTHIPFLEEWGIYAGSMFYSPDQTVFPAE